MCSVVGYIGKKSSREAVLQALKRLEYRGYDSAGYACLDGATKQLHTIKSVGPVSLLYDAVFSEQALGDGGIGIGHTRWATHGQATYNNAHPQIDCTGTIAVVHNGIIDNHEQVRVDLIKQGHTFASDTDTEVIAHLFESLCTHTDDVIDVLVRLEQRLQGSYALVILSQAYPDSLFALRKDSPLCVAHTSEGTYIVSDPLACAGKAQDMFFLPEQSIACVTNGHMQLYDMHGAQLFTPAQRITSITPFDEDKDGHEHHMLKEMYEQKGAIGKTVSHVAELDIYQATRLTRQQLAACTHIDMVGCGTSWHAARIGAFFFESIAKIPTRVHVASEMRYMPYLPQKNSMAFAISQSGETADTLQAMRMLQEHGQHTITISNMAHSSMVRQADGAIITQAGHEVAVASTKAFTTQMATLYWLAHKMAEIKGLVSAAAMRQVEDDVSQAARQLEEHVHQYKNTIATKLAPLYQRTDRAIFLGRHISYPFALEAALKLKEISYIFTQAYPAGELKHGPLALIDERTPVCIFSCLHEQAYAKLVANAHEVKARGGHITVFACAGQNELIALADQAYVFQVTQPLLEPLVMSGLMQYVAYAVAQQLGCNIDRPRNLAKSVTVE